MSIKVTICTLILILVYLSEASILPKSKDFVVPFEIKASHLKKYPQRIAPQDENGQPIEPPLFIGSFNIQTLVKRKFNNPDVMYVVENVVLRYDLILILEIHTEEDHFMDKLLKDVNSALPPEQAYKMVLSERRYETREHYAFLYRKNKLKLITSESYDEPDIFYRKPLIAIFEAFTLRDMKKFGAVGQHVKPSDAVKELDGLGDVYDYIRRKYETEDVLLMGDFNADCTYVKEKDWDNISLWYRSEFTWAITDKVDTTTNYKSCALDRLVYAGENMNTGVILSSAGIFDFQEAYQLTVHETRSISDHWPIELKIRGKMSKLAEKHLAANICFQIQDSQERQNSTADIINMAKKFLFNATKTSDGLLLSYETKQEEDMLKTFGKLRLGLPNLVGRELVEAVKYKLSHGTLNDDSSFADVNHYRHTIKILYREEMVEASVCRTTSIN